MIKLLREVDILYKSFRMNRREPEKGWQRWCGVGGAFPGFGSSMQGPEVKWFGQCDWSMYEGVVTPYDAEGV